MRWEQAVLNRVNKKSKDNRQTRLILLTSTHSFIGCFVVVAVFILLLLLMLLLFCFVVVVN